METRIDHAGIIVAHLNAPYGEVVTREHLEAALRAGDLEAIDDDLVASILSWLFVECEGETIAGACLQFDVDLQNAHNLYKCLCDEHGLPVVKPWERAVKDILC